MSKKTKVVACDLETKDLTARYDPNCPFWYGHLYGIGIDWGTRDFQALCSKLDELRKDDVLFVFHNAAFDVACFRVRGYNIPSGLYTDTMGLRYCIDPNSRKSLDQTALDYLGKSKDPKPEFSKYTDQMAKYCRTDTKLTYQLYGVLIDILSEDEQALELWYDIELPYIECIIEMQTTGSYIDRNELSKEVERVKGLVRESYKKIQKIVPRKSSGLSLIPTAFNPRSSRDIADALIRLYDWEPKKFGKSGVPTVDKHVLEELGYPLVEELRTYKKWQQYQSLTIEAIVHGITKNDIVYASFNQFNVRTGRLSSSNPNFQQVNARDERAKTARSMHIAPPGYEFVGGDLDRVELVMLAFYLECVLGYHDFADRLRAHADIHTENACRWHDVSDTVEDFKDLFRSPSKNGIFSLIYGAGVNKFAVTAKLSKQRAKYIMKNDELLIAVAELRDVLVDQAYRDEGIIHNFFGRRLTIPELMSSRSDIRAAGERKVFNYCIQGTAGDAFKVLQLDAKDVRDAEFPNQTMHSTVVHDEANYYARCEIAHEFAERMSEVYSSPDLLTWDNITMPLFCKFNVGSNWYDAK